MGIGVDIRFRLNGVVLPLFVFSSSLPIGCFHNKTKCVRGVSQEQFRDRESLKQKVKVTLLNWVSGILQAARLELMNP